MGCRHIGIIKLEFVSKTQLLSFFNPYVVDLRYFNLWILLIFLVWNIEGALPSGWEVAYGGEDFLATTQSLLRVETNTYVVRRGNN